MNKGEYIKSYFIRITEQKDQIWSAGEPLSDRELVHTSLDGLLISWKVFITTISNNNVQPTFDELIRQWKQEKSRMISRGRIHRHEEVESSVFTA